MPSVGLFTVVEPGALRERRADHDAGPAGRRDATEESDIALGMVPIEEPKAA